MMKLGALGLSIVWFFQLAHASPAQPTPTEFQELLKLDYMLFDRNYSGPWGAAATHSNCLKI